MAGDTRGIVFDDLNANGVNDGTENGLPGWTVFVDTNNHANQDSGEPFVGTDDKGKYALLGLPDGAASVYEVLQGAFRPIPGFNDHQTVTVRSGCEVRAKSPNVNTPVLTGQIAGTVYDDADENGILEPAEEALEG